MQTQTHRTTIDFDREMMMQLRQVAFDEGKPVRKVVHEAVKKHLQTKKSKKKDSFEKIWAEMGRISKHGRQDINMTEWIIKDRDRRYREAKAGLG